MPRRLLVVDDDRHMVRTLSDIFTLRGWDVTGVHSGEEAVSSVRSQPFDVVLMDILMPGMNGVEALRAIRTSKADVRVLLMTAHTENELIEQAEQNGVMRVLSKPVMIAELLEFLEADRPPGRLVVVICDENDAFLDDVQRNLEHAGHAVHRARNLDTALEHLVRHAVDVVVVNLPLGSTGPRESLVSIRQADPSAILILCSALPDVLDKAARAVPPDWIYGRLMKPFPPARLLEMLDGF